MKTTRLIGALLFVLISGCATPSEYVFESHTSQHEWTKATATLSPKELTGGVLFIFGPDGSLTLQAGNITKAPDPYAQIIESAMKEALPVLLCSQNPLLCAPGD